MRHLLRCIIPALAALSASCSDPNELAPAQNANFEDTLTLAALSGTPIQAASAYSVPDGLVRTDQTSEFEFAYDVDQQGNRLFIPQAALDVRVNNSVDPGLQLRAQTFAQIIDPPSNGYITRDTLTVNVGQVYVVRSRLVCAIGVSLYAKLEILSFDDVARTVDFRLMANNNCGYRSLGPGIPTE